MEEIAVSVFAEQQQYGHEQVVFCRDEVSGLKAIIGIHSTVLGPALGGCRMYPYQSEQAALIDVLRLSRGMTYKAAVSGLNLGGGKAVIIGDPKKHKSELLWRALGRFIEGLAGRYITAEDSGTSIDDMAVIHTETNYVVGIDPCFGGSGDPSPITALGVLAGMRAAVEEIWDGRPSVEGLKVAVQGCGHVGLALIANLVKAGAKVVASDIDQALLQHAVQTYGVKQVSPEAIYDVECDIFVPCAMGGILNEQTIPRLKCKVVAGAANNQLYNEKLDGQRLADRNILYAPDFVINAGGLINVANELAGYNRERAINQVNRIYHVMHNIFSRAKSHGMPTYQAANNLAVERIQGVGRIQQISTSNPMRGRSITQARV